MRGEVKKFRVYLIAAVKSKRIVGWWWQQSERDGVLTELNRFQPPQYMAAKVDFDAEGQTFDPADIVVPECYEQDMRRVFEVAKKYASR